MNYCPPQFKYLPSCYAESALHNGEFLITTYGTCRSREKIGDERVDSEEGTAGVLVTIDRYNATTDDEAPMGLNQFFNIPPKANVEFVNFRMLTFQQIPDAYLYCLSLDYDPALLKRFNCDSCLVIKDPVKFVNYLGQALNESVGLKQAIDFRQVAYKVRGIDVRYRDGKHHFNEDHHPAFLKPEEYKIEQEVRAVWEAATLPIKPVLVTSKEAAACCELFKPGDPRPKRPRLAVEMW